MEEFKNLKPGDIVLVHLRAKYYARVVSVEQRYYKETDPDWMYKSQRRKVGDRYGDLVTFEKIYEADFTPTKRKYTNTYDEAWMTKVDMSMLHRQAKVMMDAMDNLKQFKEKL